MWTAPYSSQTLHKSLLFQRDMIPCEANTKEIPKLESTQISQWIHHVPTSETQPLKIGCYLLILLKDKNKFHEKKNYYDIKTFETHIINITPTGMEWEQSEYTRPSNFYFLTDWTLWVLVIIKFIGWGPQRTMRDLAEEDLDSMRLDFSGNKNLKVRNEDRTTSSPSPWGWGAQYLAESRKSQIQWKGQDKNGRFC